MPLRIATFNLKDFFLPRSENERAVVEAKVANVAANLRRADADIVGLQEVGSPELVRRLVETELADLGYGTPILGSEDRRGIRNAILSRLPVQWSQVHTAKTLPFPRFVVGDPDPFPSRIPLRRGIVHARVEAGDLGEVDVLCCHFKSNMPKPLMTADGKEIPDATASGLGEAAIRSLVQRSAEALYVRRIVDGIFDKSPDHAVCVLGDLNDLPESLPVRLLRGIDTTSKHWLRAAAEMIPEEGRYSCMHGAGEILIDHLLVSERLHLALSSFHIQNEALRYHGPHVPDEPLTEDSDHALCVAEFATT